MWLTSRKSGSSAGSDSSLSGASPFHTSVSSSASRGPWSLAARIPKQQGQPTALVNGLGLFLHGALASGNKRAQFEGVLDSGT